MPRNGLGAVSRLAFLACDAVLLAIAFVNVASMRVVPDLPEEYRPAVPGLSSSAVHVGAARTVVRFEGETVGSPELLRIELCRYSPGDSVTVTDADSAGVSERTIRLVPKYAPFDIGTIAAVGALYFVFAMYIILRHYEKPFAGVLHAVSICAAIMVLFDWGSLKLFVAWFNALRWFIFDAAIWVLPSLFLHFSFIYPGDKGGHRRLFTSIFYAVSAAGLVVSVYYLVQIFLQGVPIGETHYLEFHARGSDVFLMAGLLATVANLEHSALAIRDPHERKRVYWVLLGISFGPLVYVFLILVPRTLLGYELVSQSLMQYSLLMAPLMFYLAIRKAPRVEDRQPA